MLSIKLFQLRGVSKLRAPTCKISENIPQKTNSLYVYLMFYMVWKSPNPESSSCCTGKQNPCKSSRSDNSSSSCRVNRHAAKKTKCRDGTGGGYWLMHPTKGATYGAYCDWAAWHYWGGSGISPADCGPDSADSQPGIWLPRLLDLRYWGAVWRARPWAPAPWGADFLYGY